MSLPAPVGNGAHATAPLKRPGGSGFEKRARHPLHTQGYAALEITGIHKACGISRGGLYHHFANKTAIPVAIVTQETETLARALSVSQTPIETALHLGSSQLGADPGIVQALTTTEEKRTYLSCLDQATSRHIAPALGASLKQSVRPDIDPNHLAELFLTVNAHINRRVLLEDWSETDGAAFAAVALEALAPLLQDASRLQPLIQGLRNPKPAP